MALTHTFELSVIIPSFNEQRYIKSCLDALADQTVERNMYEIIVVDNGSEDDTMNIAKEHADHVLSAPGVNVGEVRNIGADKASANIFLFLDADCLVKKSHIQECLSLATSSGQTTIFGGSINGRENPKWIEKYWLLESSGGSSQQTELMGGCILITRDAFFKVGGFPTNLTAGEDTAFSQELRKAGYCVKILKSIGVVHLGNPQTVKEFFKRQQWHAQNYLAIWPASLKDKVFWLLILYCLLLLLFFTTLLRGESISLHLILTQLPPLTISAKRLKRAAALSNLTALPIILIIDNLYLLGRLSGFIKSILKTAQKYAGLRY